MAENKIYTKTGDSGMTSLYGGTRVKKNDLKVEVYGTIDEANSAIGLAKSTLTNSELENDLLLLQNNFFKIASYFASDENGRLKTSNTIIEEDIKNIENQIDLYNLKIPSVKNFVIPGGNFNSSIFHLARTIIRRAERNIIKLTEKEEVNSNIIKYINRSSDFMFILARYVNIEATIQKIKIDIINKINNSNDDDDNVFYNNDSIITLEMARKLIKNGKQKAKHLGKKFSFSIVDTHGNLVLFEKMDNSLLGSVQISQNKAYTSVALRISTDKLTSLTNYGKELYGLQNISNEKFIIFGGGYPIYFNGKLIGGIGVSGGSVQEDMEIAEECLKIIKIYEEKEKC